MASTHPEGTRDGHTLDRLLRTVADVLVVDPTTLSSTTEADDVDDWDSLRTIHLALALEEEFGVSLSPDEIATLQSVPAILALLAVKGFA